MQQWQNIEKTAKDQIEEKKIRVVFLPAEDITPNHKQVNGLVCIGTYMFMSPLNDPREVIHQLTSPRHPHTARLPSKLPLL